jgi:hypothetical protein
MDKVTGTFIVSEPNKKSGINVFIGCIGKVIR